MNPSSNKHDLCGVYLAFYFGSMATITKIFRESGMGCKAFTIVEGGNLEIRHKRKILGTKDHD
jgi:hypothetical protein